MLINYILILINNIQLTVSPFHLGISCKLPEGFITQEQLNGIPLLKFLISCSFFSVQGNVLFAEHFVEKALGCFTKKLCQVFVEALSGFIFFYNKFFHSSL